MRNLAITSLLAAALAVLMNAAPAEAQATRTWVSGVGDDVNPCSRTAPCKTFAGAISKTAINGEINCLDPGGFGAVTITKSITIDCANTHGSILASFTNGIIINITTSAANDPLATVRLRGLSINGAGSGTATGIDAIRVSNANTRRVKLYVDKTAIQNFTANGIFFNGPGGDLVVTDTVIFNTGAGGSSASAGIRTLSTLAGATGIIKLVATRVTSHYGNIGVRLEGNSFGTISNSIASNNSRHGFMIIPINIGNAELNIVDCVASNNQEIGVSAGGTGQTGIVRIFNLTAFNNPSNQLRISSGGQILSNGRNHIGTPSNSPGTFTDQ